jgi:hypothetical protein
MTPIGSGDEANADATLAGVDAELSFKAAKGKKKSTSDFESEWDWY